MQENSGFVCKEIKPNYAFKTTHFNCWHHFIFYYFEMKSIKHIAWLKLEKAPCIIIIIIINDSNTCWGIMVFCVHRLNNNKAEI